MKFYKCDVCGNILEVIRDSAIVPNCCNKSMNLIKSNSDDSAAKEKHVPVYLKNENEIVVTVGSILHPSMENHYIEWIELETNKGCYRKFLTSLNQPSTTFLLENDEEVVNIYAYCNIHGLWSIK